MLNTTHLAASVEASRLRKVEADEDYFDAAATAERRATEVAAALQSWSPSLACRHVSAAWYCVAITEPERTFAEAFTLSTAPGFQSVHEVSGSVLLVRVVGKQFESIEAAERWVLEQCAVSFMPF
jgi:hypothetical protein